MSGRSNDRALAPPSLHAPPDALAREAWLLDPPRSHELPHVDRDAAGFLLDGLLGRVVRSRGALDVAIGERLDLLAGGDRTLRLGYCSIGDYARERLGIAGGTAKAMARLARDLRERPVLREAVRMGEVSPRKAQAIVPVARGEAEAAWAGRAKAETVRALEAAVRAAGRTEPAETEDWERISVQLAPQDKEKLDEAMDLAGRLLGAGAPKWQRLEVICQEFLGANPGDETQDGTGREQVPCGPVADWLSAAKEGLEAEMRRWEFLGKLEPVAAPASVEDADCGAALPLSQRLDDELRALVGMRDRWDELVGHLAMLVRMLGLPRYMGFASFGHYCEERLGMAARTIEQRIWLERRFYSLPKLRVAMREGRVSYEKARLVAQVADDGSSEAWIAKAEKIPCIALRREIEAAEETQQMCGGGALGLRVPRRVRFLLDAAIRAVRMGTDRWIEPGRCLGIVAEHFIETWKGSVPRRRSRQQRVLDRDGGFCQVPGCSRAAAHVHHVVFRSACGGDDETNLVSLCAAHHLHGVHMGWIRVEGQAPDGLRWKIGERRD